MSALSEQVLHITAPPEELEAYRQEAARLGFPVEEWVRRTLNTSLDRQSAPAVQEVAFRHLDEMPETGLAALIAGPQPARPPTPPPEMKTRAPTDKLPLGRPPSIGHPCIFLKPKLPGVLASGEVCGTCDQPSQRGKPCFWGAEVAARSCGVFQLRHDLRSQRVRPNR